MARKPQVPPGDERLDRGYIDEHRGGSVEQHVRRSSVLENEPMPNQLLIDVQRMQRGLGQHCGGPFGRNRYERKAIVAEPDAVQSAQPFGNARGIDFARCDHGSAMYESTDDIVLDQCLKSGRLRRMDQAQDPVLHVEERA